MSYVIPAGEKKKRFVSFIIDSLWLYMEYYHKLWYDCVNMIMPEENCSLNLFFNTDL